MFASDLLPSTRGLTYMPFRTVRETPSTKPPTPFVEICASARSRGARSPQYGRLLHLLSALAELYIVSATNVQQGAGRAAPRNDHDWSNWNGQYAPALRSSRAACRMRRLGLATVDVCPVASGLLCSNALLYTHAHLQHRLCYASPHSL